MPIIELPMQITSPKKRYSAVGRCIYCGAYASKLQDEHIVPFGLVGDLVVLPKSSCTQCASITGKTEQYCLRGMLGSFRVVIGSPTRRPKERPKTIALRRGRFDPAIGAFESPQTLTIEPKDMPLMYPSVAFPGAGILENRHPDTQVNWRMSLHGNTEDYKEFVRAQGSQNATAIAPIYPLEFVRMVAKIAHGFAVAELTMNGFYPFLLPLILGKVTILTHGLHWVGTEPGELPAAAEIVSMSWNKVFWEGHRKLLIVKLRLFPCFQAPTYHIVVGTWDGL
jgi:hypothetical protein